LRPRRWGVSASKHGAFQSLGIEECESRRLCGPGLTVFGTRPFQRGVVRFGPLLTNPVHICYCGVMASKELAELLKEVRESKGVSLRGAAKELQVDASYLSRVERGNKSASSRVLDRAATYYELPRERLALAAGALPADVLAILRAHPEIVDRLRKTYGPR
jgi:hypothetical protein